MRQAIPDYCPSLWDSRIAYCRSAPCEQFLKSTAVAFPLFRLKEHFTSRNVLQPSEHSCAFRSGLNAYNVSDDFIDLTRCHEEIGHIGMFDGYALGKSLR